MAEVTEGDKGEDLPIAQDDLQKQLGMEGGKDAAYHHTTGGKGIVAEEYPCQTDEMEGDDNRQHPTPATTAVMLVVMKYVLREKLMTGKCQPVHTSPCHKIERCAMP